MKTLRNMLGNVRWWLDIIYPLGLAVVVVYILTSAMYADRKHRRVASFWENQLLGISLRFAGEPPSRTPGEIVVINFTTEDVETFGKQSASGLIDARIQAYAQILNKIATSDFRQIVLSWTPGAHEVTTKAYAPLVSVLQQPDLHQRVLAGYPQGKGWTVPTSFSAAVVPLSDLSCQEPVEMLCPYMPNMRDWIIQRLFEDAITTSDDKAADKPAISTNLTLPQAGYILYLPRREQLTQLSFTQVLAADFSTESLRDKFIYIGNNMVQGPQVGDQVDLIRRVFTVHDRERGNDLRNNGTPMHIFWASLTQQLRSHMLIPVPPRWLTLFFAGAICICSWLLIAYRGLAAALASYLIFVLLMPFINAFGIKQQWFYVPVFDAYYAGVISLIFASFVRLSYTTFTRWKSIADSRLENRTRDLKENFVSMFSHNLNTPIAKVLGTLEIINQQSNSPEQLNDLHTALLTATQMQLLVRCALISAAARENSLGQENLTIASLRQELVGTLPQVARRLGFQLNFTPMTIPDDEVLPIQCDRRAITTLVLSMLALAKQEQTNTKITMGIEAIVDQGVAFNRNLRLIFDGRGWGEVRTRDQLLNRPASTSMDSFFIHVLEQTINEVLRSYHARVSHDVDRIIIELACARGIAPQRDA